MPGLDSQNIDDFYNNYVVPGESPDHEAAPPQDNQPPDFSRLYNPIHDAIAGIGDSVGGASDAAGGMLTPDGPTVRFGAPPPNLPQSQSRSAGVSTSEGSTAINLDTFGQMETKGHRGIDATLARAKNETNAEFAPFAENAMAASENQRKAIGQETAAVTAKNDADAKFQQDIATRMKQNAADDERDYALAQVKTQAYMADYEKSINQLASMTVNPGRAYSELSGNARAGIKVTAFITDFLGAKGIKTSGMDYINRGIDMDIQAQKDAINLQKDVTQGKQNLWQMQRQQSESDYEATVRTRGALLNAFKTEIAGKLAAFDSPIARAKAAEASAAVDQELVKTLTTLKQLADNSYQAKAQNAVSIRGQDVTASIASADRAQKAQFREEDNRAALKASGMVDLNELRTRAINDTEGNLVGYTKDKESRETFQNKIDGYTEFQDAMTELQQKLRDSGSLYSGLGSSLTMDVLQTKYASLYNKVLHAYVKSQSGASYTDKDFKSLQSVLPPATLTRALLAEGDSAGISARTYAMNGADSYDDMMKKARAHLSAETRPEVIAALKGGTTAGSFARSEANSIDNTKTSEGVVRVSTPAARLAGSINEEGSKPREPERADSKDIQDDAYLLNIPPEAGASVNTGAIVPAWFNDMEGIAKLTVSGDSKERQDAANQLGDFITFKSRLPGMAQSDVGHDQALAAFYLYNKYKELPVNKDLSFKDIPDDIEKQLEEEISTRSINPFNSEK